MGVGVELGHEVRTLSFSEEEYKGVPQAMHLVAATASIILYPTYTAKSMSALIAEIQVGNVYPETPTVFIDSGGSPQTFALPNQIYESSHTCPAYLV